MQLKLAFAALRQHRLQVLRARREVGEQIDQHRRMRHNLRPDHPRALAAAEERDRPSANLKARTRDLQLRVRREDRGRKRLRMLHGVAERGLRRRYRRDQLLHRQRNADDSRRGREDLIKHAMKLLRHRNAALLARVDTRLSRRAVRIACVHQQRGHAIARRDQVPTTDDERCGDHLVARKHRSGIGSAVAHGKRNVRLARSLNTSGHGRPAKAERKRMCGGSVAHRKILLMFYCEQPRSESRRALPRLSRKSVIPLRRILIR